ncbi:MAG: hypothetical protein DRJ40_01130 [Thermoprotei archaeon]|nr:MAG: hypothetical protein DRJ40_01130 [Thermoprotei archaeon]
MNIDIRSLLERLRTVKVMVIGPPYAGKTTLLQAIDSRCRCITTQANSPAPYRSTVFIDSSCIVFDLNTGRWFSSGSEFSNYLLESQSAIDNAVKRFIKVKFIGTPGQRRFEYQRDILFSLHKVVDVVALVVDSASESSINEIPKFLDLVKAKLRYKALLLVANKQDIPGALPGSEIAKRFGIQEFVETSALHGWGVDRFVRKCVELGLS